MTVRKLSDGTIEIAGHCGLEDAEALHAQLLSAPDACVDWAACESLHTATLQVLLAARPELRGTPSAPFLCTHIAPLLAEPHSNDAPDSDQTGTTA